MVLNASIFVLCFFRTVMFLKFQFFFFFAKAHCFVFGRSSFSIALGCSRSLWESFRFQMWHAFRVEQSSAFTSSLGTQAWCT